MILRPPERKNGMFNSVGVARRGPDNTGESDAPVVLAMPVKPAAAERSSGLMMAIV